MKITMRVPGRHFIDVNLINIVQSIKLHLPEVRHELCVAYICIYVSIYIYVCEDELRCSAAKGVIK